MLNFAAFTTAERPFFLFPFISAFYPHTTFMKLRKAVFFTVFAALVALVALLCGSAFVSSRLDLSLTLDGKEVYSGSFECSSSASVRIRLFYGGSPSALYESKFSGNPTEFFEYLNGDINAELRKAIRSVERDAQEPAVSYEGDGVFRYTDGVNGIKCDEHATLDKLARSGSCEMVYRPVFPLSTVDELKKITAEAGKFSTEYGTSSAARKKNVELAASRLNGATVMPGENLSFNETVGKRTKENGFAEAKVILNGQYSSGVGGGVCQVSTTLYNAWLMTGQNAVYSRSHSLKPGYVSPGLDAMVSDASDLVLSNCGDYPMYISAKGNGSTLTVTVYSLPLPCDVRLGCELVRTIPCDDYELVDGESDEILSYPRNGAVYRSYREYSENGEVICKEYLRTSTYLPQKGKKYRRKQTGSRIEQPQTVHNNIRTLYKEVTI